MEQTLPLWSARGGAWVSRVVTCAAIVLATADCGSGDSSTASGAGGGGAQPWLHATPAWSSLYGEYFGPAGVASCSVSGAMCHNSASQPGSVASNFICADKEGCYTSLTGASNLVSPMSDPMQPSDTLFLKKLRTPGGTGRMPSMSTFEFQPQDIDLITSWIANGAKDD